jgi:hypothetical protein
VTDYQLTGEVDLASTFFLQENESLEGGICNPKMAGDPQGMRILQTFKVYYYNRYLGIDRPDAGNRLIIHDS